MVYGNYIYPTILERNITIYSSQWKSTANLLQIKPNYAVLIEKNCGILSEYVNAIM